MSIELNAELRTDMGKGASRRLRREQNLVPGILYGGTHDPMPISLNHNHVIKALKNEAFYSHILTLHIDGKPEKAVLKAMQRHHSKPKIMHMDFQRVSATEKIKMHVPLHFLGEDVAPGVKLGGGIVTHMITDLEIQCLPAHLPEYIEVDLSQLELDHALHLSDIKLPEGVELATAIVDAEHDSPVANITLPRAAAAESTEEEGEGAEGEEGEEGGESSSD